jgi:hypothetical protein
MEPGQPIGLPNPLLVAKTSTLIKRDFSSRPGASRGGICIVGHDGSTVGSAFEGTRYATTTTGAANSGKGEVRATPKITFSDQGWLFARTSV